MEHMPAFRTHRPDTVAEAVRLASAEPGARFLGGGTDLVVNVRRGIEAPGALIDVSAVAALRAVTVDDDGVHLGAGVTLRDLAALPEVQRDYAAVAEAAAAVAGPTHREYGTLGGNLCLDTRCLYYNQSEWWRASNDYCLKHRGDICHVAPGGKRCFAAFSGDVAPALLVHGAEVTLIGGDGERRIPLAALYRNDGRAHLALEPGELLTNVHLPAATAGLPSAYAKARVRGSIDFPLAGIAVSLRRDGGTVAALRVALTGVNPQPHLLKGLDDFAGKPLDEEALDRLAEMTQSQAKPMRTTTIAPWYRRRVAGALARRLAARLAAEK